MIIPQNEPLEVFQRESGSQPRPHGTSSDNESIASGIGGFEIEWGEINDPVFFPASLHAHQPWPDIF
jgi:hypothetical protein